jgi:Uma2 family endonuclease
MERGFEPDCFFYFANAQVVRGKRHLDRTDDPPPDLVIEIDLTHSSLLKLPVLAALGVPEVWRYRGDAVEVLQLGDGRYESIDRSQVLPMLTAQAISEQVAASKATTQMTWLRQLRSWARRLDR